MVMCLRKISGLNKVKLIDAVWIWTEPHSMRLKIKLTVQKEVMTGAVVQQATVVEFTIRNQQCKHCEASFATGAWHAIVQVRQRVPHKRTFFYLEQLILKHEAHTECIKIVTFRDGMDFYYKDKNQALRFIEFLNNNVPTRMNYSRKLVSADHTNNTADFKHNYLIEIAPICKDDLLLLPRDLASKQSNISPLVLVKRVAAGLHVVDPLTGERSEINADKYWRHEFNAIFNCRSLTRYVVLSVEPVLLEQKASARMKRGRGRDGEKMSSRAVSRLAEVVVARERDLGSEDTQFTVVSHLGPLLSPGDIVLGYDFSSSNLNLDANDEEYLRKLPSLPDVVLVRKSYEHRGDRAYTLRNLENVVPMDKPVRDDKGDYDADLEDFLQQLDADKEMRAQMNLYKKTMANKNTKTNNSKKRVKTDDKDVTMANDEDDDVEEKRSEVSYDEEEVRLDELLDDLTLSTTLLPEEEGRILSTAEAEKVSSFDYNAFQALGEDDDDL
jgi:nonsense-mediated mRNA decay protein 3